MIPAFFLSLSVSFVTAFFIFKSQNFYKVYLQDHQLKGKQKFHIKPVPRIGGISIIIGIVAAKLPLFLVLASLPIFIGGLLEDLTKKISPKIRLTLSFFSALVAFYGLDIGIQSIGWDWFDNNIFVGGKRCIRLKPNTDATIVNNKFYGCSNPILASSNDKDIHPMENGPVTIDSDMCNHVSAKGSGVTCKRFTSPLKENILNPRIK